MQYSQEHLKTMVYAKFGGQKECIMGNSKIVNRVSLFISQRIFTGFYFLSANLARDFIMRSEESKECQFCFLFVSDFHI